MNNYVKNRNIYFSGEVDEESTAWLIFELQNIIQEDDEKESKEIGYIRNPITLYINCRGGYVPHGLNIYDVVRSSKTEINTICLQTMSMGFIIFLAGKHRKMYKNSMIVNHSLSHRHSGMLQDMRDSIDNSEKLQEIMNDIILENTKIPKDKQLEVIKLKEDWYIYSEEALELGVVHEII